MTTRHHVLVRSQSNIAIGAAPSRRSMRVVRRRGAHLDDGWVGEQHCNRGSGCDPDCRLQRHPAGRMSALPNSTSSSRASSVAEYVYSFIPRRFVSLPQTSSAEKIMADYFTTHASMTMYDAPPNFTASSATSWKSKNNARFDLWICDTISALPARHRQSFVFRQQTGSHVILACSSSSFGAAFVIELLLQFNLFPPIC